MIIEGRMNLDQKGLEKELKKRGWSLSRTGTQHDLWKHPKTEKLIALPRHKGAIPNGTVHSILSKSAQVRESILPSLKRLLAEINQKQTVKKKTTEKIILNKNRSKVIIHPPLKEGLDQIDNQRVITPAEMVKAVYFPEGIIGDPDARPALKDYAFQILQLRRGNT